MKTARIWQKKKQLEDSRKNSEKMADKDSKKTPIKTTRLLTEIEGRRPTKTLRIHKVGRQKQPEDSQQKSSEFNSNKNNSANNEKIDRSDDNENKNDWKNQATMPCFKGNFIVEKLYCQKYASGKQ